MLLRASKISGKSSDFLELGFERSACGGSGSKTRVDPGFRIGEFGNQD